MRLRLVPLLVILLLVSGVMGGAGQTAFAQNVADDMATEAAAEAVEGVAESTDSAGPPEKAAARDGARERGLARVLEARAQIEADLRALQSSLDEAAARGREAEIEDGIRALSEELAALNRNFSELAAGVDPASIDAEQTPQQLNLGDEVRELLGPLVNELKRATSRPRGRPRCARPIWCPNRTARGARCSSSTRWPTGPRGACSNLSKKRVC